MKEEKKTLVKLREVAMAFGDLQVHRDISFTLHQGEVVTLLGPSGSGKTIILKLIMGLLRPTNGEIYLCSHSLLDLGEEELRQLRRHVGMLFQGAALFDSMTVEENIAFPLHEFHDYSESSIRAIVLEKLDLVGLAHTLKKMPSQLSGGQRKRVGLARALATSPELLLFDEPTTGLDPTAKGKIDDLIERLRDDHGITSLVVTHDMESAHRISDRLLLIDQGKIIVDGPAESLWKESAPIRSFARGTFASNVPSTPAPG